jgi:co-chaperonin GroES (HSP10)
LQSKSEKKKEKNMLTPIAKKILIKPLEQKQGNIILTNQKPKKFKIVAIGDEVTKVKIGDTIYLENHYGVEIEEDNQKYFIIEENSILAKLD